MYKSGACYDVGVDVFSAEPNDQMKDTIIAENRAWAKLAVEQLKAGTSQECGEATNSLGRLSSTIAQQGILAF